MTTQLTLTQHAILAHAIQHRDGKIDWFPDNIKGGARKKVLDGMFNRALITTDGTDWFVAAEGYDAMGRDRPAPEPVTADSELDAAVTAAEATWAQDKAAAKPRTRENSKQATVIQMLQRPEGGQQFGDRVVAEEGREQAVLHAAVGRGQRTRLRDLVEVAQRQAVEQGDVAEPGSRLHVGQ